MRVVLMALALAACSPAAEAPKQEAPAAGGVEQAQNTEANLAAMPNAANARAAGVDFRGVGQEPGWIIDIYTQNRIVLLLDYGETMLEFPLPQADTSQEFATRYQTQANGRNLAVTIRRAPCEDVMSGEPYPSTVEVVIDGRTLTGCGKSV